MHTHAHDTLTVWNSTQFNSVLSDWLNEWVNECVSGRMSNTATTTSFWWACCCYICFVFTAVIALARALSLSQPSFSLFSLHCCCYLICFHLLLLHCSWHLILFIFHLDSSSFNSVWFEATTETMANDDRWRRRNGKKTLTATTATAVVLATCLENQHKFRATWFTHNRKMASICERTTTEVLLIWTEKKRKRKGNK